MSPRVIGSAEELQQLVGQEIGTSEWVGVEQAKITTFAETTGDRQWIHVDPERAAASSFGGTIAHGYMTLALCPGFGAEIFSLEFGSARLNYGVNSVRFPHPVREGSKLRGTATFVDLKPLPKGIQLTTRYVIEIEGEERPACVAECLTLILP